VQMARLTFADKLGDSLYDDYLGSGRVIVALYQLMPNKGSQWFTELGDTAVTGRDAVAGAAVDAAAKDLVKLLGSDMTKWRWGDIHAISFDHPLAAVKPLDLIFRIGPVRRAGDGYSPNNGAYAVKKPFALTTQPSERQIVDLGDIDASLSIIPVGQSGQPYSRHWGDQTQLWASGQYKSMALTRERIGQLEGKLVLRPR
ncbi:MAG TPA: penicillin acylase family protein, partial [Candidatus Acidoferrales bacterium]|nr:penicillin acylase family protein [Candidatus Acidoferrales bacterium]